MFGDDHTSRDDEALVLAMVADAPADIRYWASDFKTEAKGHVLAFNEYGDECEPIARHRVGHAAILAGVRALAAMDGEAGANRNAIIGAVMSWDVTALEEHDFWWDAVIQAAIFGRIIYG